jgi:hypothetical protein
LKKNKPQDLKRGFTVCIWLEITGITLSSAEASGEILIIARGGRWEVSLSARGLLGSIY